MSSADGGRRRFDPVLVEAITFVALGVLGGLAIVGLLVAYGVIK